MRTRSFRSQRFDLAVDTVTRDDVADVVDWLEAFPKLTMAGETQAFEAEWSRWLGVRHSVFCNSGSSANLLMYAALDATGRGGRRKVIVPATGWVTTIAPAIQTGWRPMMCETARDTYGLDLAQLEKLLRRTRAETVVLVHVLGVPNDMTALRSLQRAYGFNLVEDCCGSHGSRHAGRKVGTFGCLSSFSFFYGHHMSTLEGGMVCTDDDDLYEALLMLRSHGWLKDLPPRRARQLMKDHGVDPFHRPFTFILPGYNLRPTDLAARLGRIQLRRLDDVVRRRIANHAVYQRLLAGCVDFAKGLPGDDVSSISFCAVAASSAQRRRIVQALDRHRIDTRLFTAGNLGRHPFWTARYGRFSAPMADCLYDRAFFLPNNQTLRPAELEFVADVVRAAAARKPRRRPAAGA